MIDDVDETLKALIRREALGSNDVEVLFDAPNRDWAARRNTPAVDVYLYDIREDMKWRAYGSVDVRDPASGYVTAREKPPRHFKLSYLVTAWTQRPEDEHRLLASVLRAFLRFDILPKDALVGTLAELNWPIMTAVGLPPPDDRSVSDVWTALGGELKASLDVVVTVPVDTRRRDTDIAKPVLEQPRFSFAGDQDGGPRARRRGRTRQDATAAEVVAEETVDAGAEAQRGRIFRVRNIEQP